MMKTFFLFSILVVTVCCHGVSKSTTESTGTLHQPSGDSSITIKANNSFSINLVIQPGSGFSWVRKDSSYKYVRFDGEQFKNREDAEGGSGVQIFNFRAIAKGKDTVSLIYVQPFNKPFPANAVVKTFIISII